MPVAACLPVQHASLCCCNPSTTTSVAITQLRTPPLSAYHAHCLTTRLSADSASFPVNLARLVPCGISGLPSKACVSLWCFWLPCGSSCGGLQADTCLRGNLKSLMSILAFLVQQLWRPVVFVAHSMRSLCILGDHVRAFESLSLSLCDGRTRVCVCGAASITNTGPQSHHCLL